VWDQQPGSNTRLDALAKKCRASDYVEAGLKFVLSAAELSCTFCGMERVSEVEQNVAMAGQRLARSDLDILQTYGRLAGNTYCRMCDSCGPCPQGVAISDILRFLMYHDNYGHFERSRRLYAELKPECRADHCAHCGRCEKLCPNGLPVREKLRAAHNALA